MFSWQVDVSPKPRPAGLRVSEPFRVILDPLEHVKEAPRTLVVPFRNRLVAQIPDLVQVSRLHIILSVSSNHGGLDSCFSIFLSLMGSGLVEQEAAAYLDLLIFSQP